MYSAAKHIAVNCNTSLLINTDANLQLEKCGPITGGNGKLKKNSS